MTQIITPDDVASFTAGMSEKDVQTLVDGLNAKASRVAPCLASTDPPPMPGQLAEAKMILIGAIKRWAEAGSGAFSQQTAGPFAVSVDTRQRNGGYNLWPSEIEGLEDLCRSVSSDAYMIDMTGLTGRRDPLTGAIVNSDCPPGMWSDKTLGDRL